MGTPEEFAEEGNKWKLFRCLYGLNDVPSEWYNRIEKVLGDLGAKKSSYDGALFLWHKDHQLCGI